MKAFQTTGKIDQKFGNAKKIVQYRIYPVNIESRAKDPKSWNLEASNNGTDYVILDTQTNQSFQYQQWKTFNVNNENEYLYYRLNVTENNGDATYAHVQELELYNCETFEFTPTPTPTPVAQQDPTPTPTPYVGEVCEKEILVDLDEHGNMVNLQDHIPEYIKVSGA